MPTSDATAQEPYRPYPGATCGRADLMRALAAGTLADTAALLGYRPRPALAEPVIRGAEAIEVAERSKTKRLRETSPTLSPTILWRPEAYEDLDGRDRDEGVEEVETDAETGDDEVAEPFPTTLPPVRLRAQFAELLPGLRRAAAVRRPVLAPDVSTLVREVGRGNVPCRVPRLRRRRWGETLLVLRDPSPRLLPFAADFKALRDALKTVFPCGAVTSDEFDGVGQGPIPPRGAVVLALSDLGTLARDTSAPAKAWAAYGRDLAAADCHAAAMLPAAPDVPLAALTRWWKLAGWEPLNDASSPPRDLAPALAALAALVAPAVTLSPGLVRDLLPLLPGGMSHGALEPAFWQSDYLASPHPTAAIPAAQHRLDALKAFRALDLPTRRAALAVLRRWRGRARWAWYEEILGLDDETRACVPKADVDEAAVACLAIANSMVRGDAPSGARSWFMNLAARAPEETWADPEPAKGERPARWRSRWRRGWIRAWRAAHAGVEAAPPPNYDPAFANQPEGARRRHYLRQVGDDITFSADLASEGDLGSPLGWIDARNAEAVVEPLPPFWKSGDPLPWAEAWGCDAIGPWVEFAFSARRGPAVVQRMRWIPAGRFMMGSPEEEAERSSDEGPRHEVTISRGFWLFDTACTQALWRAVMGKNPSQFKGDDRPVETVSWHDAHVFVTSINALVPGLDIDLPTEAQWEYACRAGTESPFSFGSNINPDLVNYDGNNPYAEGVKGTWRKETVPVASLPANPFGLFEMHGNVWEWCADGPRDYADTAVTDPVGPDDSVAGRVLRGGSWLSRARGCRSAYRSADDPGLRDSDAGFRCARVQAGAEPGGAQRIRQAERRSAASRSGAAERGVMVPGGPAARRPLPPAAPFVIRTDCERLTFAPMSRPDWASAVGRDRYGLWARFEVAGADGVPVSQRMRWIPPGSFRMGSPEDEPERFENEGPPQIVTFAQGFWLFDTACPQELWRAVMGNNPSRFTDDSGRLPVEQVSWNDCVEFIAKINAQNPGLNLALPSEAQWEYACRAGTTTPFSFGANVTPAQVNYDGNFPYADGQKGEYRNRTVPVASLPSNPWGLHEMHGNVWEWCADVFHDSYADAPIDGSARLDAENGARRVLRGGSWIFNARDCRSACRSASDPGGRDIFIGFRCARVQGERSGDGAWRVREGAEPPDRSAASSRSGHGG